ncbi:hypothetical protein [Nocardia sp. NPDC003963]
MIVVVSSEADPESTEAMVGRLLASWRTGSGGVGGVAVVGCNVQSMTKNRVYGLDVLVWTPYGCTVIEVKGFCSAQSGVLDPRINGTWRVGSAPADLYSLDSAANPVAQGRPYMYAVKDNFKAARLPEWVELLVVLAPLAKADLTIRSSKLTDGIFVVAAPPGNDRSLLEHFTPKPGDQPCWSGDDIQRAFDLLDLDEYLPSPDQLAHEGFTVPRPPTVAPKPIGSGDDPFAPAPVPATARRGMHPPLSPPIPRGRLSPLTQPISGRSAADAPPGTAPPRADGRDARRWSDDDLDDVFHARPVSDSIEQPRRPRRPVGERYPSFPAAAPPPFTEPAARRWTQWPGLDTAISVLAIIVLAFLLLMVVRCGSEASSSRIGDPARSPAGQVQPSRPVAPHQAPPPVTPSACMPFQAC